MEIHLRDAIDLLKPGDIGLTVNPQSLGKIINFGQELEGDESKYGHAFVVAKRPGKAFISDGSIFESVHKISRNRIGNYIDKEVCIIRHRLMTKERFFLGREEILDNIGQTYPYIRLGFHALDISCFWLLNKLSGGSYKMPRFFSKTDLDWPVCSELAAQFILKAEIPIGNNIIHWAGVNPDQLDDTRLKNVYLWETIIEAKLIA